MIVAHSALLLVIKSLRSSPPGPTYSLFPPLVLAPTTATRFDQRSKPFFRLVQTAMKTLVLRGGGFGMGLS